MSQEILEFLNSYVESYKKLEHDYYLGEWDSAMSGKAKDFERAAVAKQAFIEWVADPEVFAKLKAWDDSGTAGDDAQLARQVRILRLESEQYQMDKETIALITDLEKKCNELYVTFRGKIDGEPVSDNEIEIILDEEDDNEKRRKAWEASKMIGPEIQETMRELARLRNKGAVKMGYRNYHHMALTLAEIDEKELFDLLDKLYDLTVEPFAKAKAELDDKLSKRFGVPVDELRPWHYADPFFQSAPQMGESSFDQYFKGKDLESLGVYTYDGIGMDVGDIMERSDLYAREGKYQHAFCIDIDREGDVRTVCNLVDNLRWATTLLHELGHAVYDKYTDLDLPWLLRGPNHTMTTEAMAIMAGRFTLDRTWLLEILKVDEETVDGLLPVAKSFQQLNQMIFARWVMVMVNFERALYSDPDQDLDTLWWELVEKFQLVQKPEGRSAPDWATKIHIALYPAYYQNYLLGALISWQWADRLNKEVGGIVNQKEAGAWLIENVFRRGQKEDWNTALEIATGERLDPKYYVEQMLG